MHLSYDFQTSEHDSKNDFKSSLYSTLIYSFLETKQMDLKRAKRIRFICISTFDLFRKCEGHIKEQTRLWHISGNIHDPLYECGGLVILNWQSVSL